MPAILLQRNHLLLERINKFSSFSINVLTPTAPLAVVWCEASESFTLIAVETRKSQSYHLVSQTYLIQRWREKDTIFQSVWRTTRGETTVNISHLTAFNGKYFQGSIEKVSMTWEKHVSDIECKKVKKAPPQNVVTFCKFMKKVCKSVTRKVSPFSGHPPTSLPREI